MLTIYISSNVHDQANIYPLISNLISQFILYILLFLHFLLIPKLLIIVNKIKLSKSSIIF